jgi:hypothetical protein
MRRASLLALVALLASLAAPLPDAGTRYSRVRPETTTEGDFFGTWIYQSVSLRFAFFIRPGETGLELRVRWESQGAESFETDYEGHAGYTFRGFPAEVFFTIDREASNLDVILGDYLRQLTLEEGDYRKESGRFRIERARDGRTIVWSFDQYEQEYKTVGKVETGSRDDVFYLMHKISRRVVDWEEIPW